MMNTELTTAIRQAREAVERLRAYWPTRDKRIEQMYDAVEHLARVVGHLSDKHRRLLEACQAMIATDAKRGLELELRGPARLSPEEAAYSDARAQARKAISAAEGTTECSSSTTVPR